MQHDDAQAGLPVGESLICPRNHPTSRFYSTATPHFRKEGGANHTQAYGIERTPLSLEGNGGKLHRCTIDPPEQNQMSAIYKCFVPVVSVDPAHDCTQIGPADEAIDHTVECDLHISARRPQYGVEGPLPVGDLAGSIDDRKCLDGIGISSPGASI